jgi:hypothetical protein
MTVVIKKGEEGWLIYKVRKSTRTLLRMAPLKTPRHFCFQDAKEAFRRCETAPRSRSQKYAVKIQKL